MSDPARRLGNRPRLLALAAAAATIAAGALSAPGATGQSADPRPHLLIVPDTPEGEAALDRSDARVVARYESFSLVEARGDDTASLRRAGADVRDDMRRVRTAEGSFDPSAARDPLVGKREDEPAGAGLALVQFVGPVKQAWLDRLERTGVEPVSYMAENAYLVHGSGDELGDASALLGGDPAVRAVTAFAAADKLAGKVEAGEDRRVVIQTVAGAAGAAARRSVDAAGRELRKPYTLGNVRTQVVELPPGRARQLAADPGVVAVRPERTPKLLDERAAQIVAGNVDGSGKALLGDGYLDWLESAPNSFPTTELGFAIDVTDEGIDRGSTSTIHPDFAGRAAYMNNYTSDADARDCGGHGTNVASIAAGLNTGTGSGGSTAVEDSAGFNYGLGIAPRAQIGASKIFRCSSGAFQLNTSFQDLASDAWAGGARISNNSWGTSVGGEYDEDSQVYDALVRDASSGDSGNQELVEVIANGNDGPSEGSVGSPATAKNVISVGASENDRTGPSGGDGCGVEDDGADDARDIIDFSSRGPTEDGRIKPDVVAPGTHVVGARPQGTPFNGSGTCNPQFPAGNTLYTLVSGTSQATPEASGMAALIRDWYSRPTVGNAAPSPALTKALMINTASDIQGGDDGDGGTISAVPNMDQGWGRINMGNVLDGTPREYRDQIPADSLTASGQTRENVYAVQDTGDPVKVTLAWTDPPPDVLGVPAWVNNLDLEVDAGGRTYRGNVFGSNGFSQAGGSSDERNNLENVYLPAGTSGPFTVRVRGTQINEDGVPGGGVNQDFALVVSNAAETDAPVLTHASTDELADSEPDTGSDVEPGEGFSFKQSVKNTGDQAASGTPLQGTVSGDPGEVTFGTATSAFADIATGATEQSTGSYAGTLASGAACGKDVPVTLSMATSAGTQEIPFSIPTGATGPAITRGSANVPRGIPDQGSVSSTLDVSDPGTVRDLELRITSLTHTWVGDLRVELSHEDGTTVVLADRPGGAGNNNNGFTDVVFSDDAAAAIGAAPPGETPYSGDFRPQADQLSRFDGKPQDVTWTLKVTDLAPGDAGTLSKWSADVRAGLCTDEPETAPTAAVTGPSVANPLTDQDVTFDDASDDPDTDGDAIVYREWDTDGDDVFDDGNGTSVTVRFADDGPQTVQLRITDDDGASDTVSSGVVNVQNRAPSASISQSPGAPLTNQSVAFTSSASDSDGTIAARAWDLDNDGAFDDGSGSSATRSFSASGAYVVRVRVTDDDGASTVATRTVGIANRGPVAAFAFSPSAPMLGQAVSFASGAFDPDGPLASQSWDLDGDGQYDDASGAAATHSFPLSGSFSVGLRVVDGNGAAAEQRQTVNVSALPPPPPLAATLKRSRMSLTTAISRGLAFTVDCTRACSGRIDLLLTARTARKLKLQRSKRRSYVAGKKAVRLTEAGSGRVVVKLGRKLRRRLRAANSLSLKARLRVRDDGGATKTLTRRVRLRR